VVTISLEKSKRLLKLLAASPFIPDDKMPALTPKDGVTWAKKLMK